MIDVQISVRVHELKSIIIEVDETDNDVSFGTPENKPTGRYVMLLLFI